eukprot:GSChrysophyteH1.ASY1.ANO1.1958.1 assembled CDS
MNSENMHNQFIAESVTTPPLAAMEPTKEVAEEAAKALPSPQTKRPEIPPASVFAHKPQKVTLTVGSFDARVTVCPAEGTMSGLCISVKHMSASNYFGGKGTKRRWYEIDGTHFKWCAGHIRENTFKGSVPLSKVTRVYDVALSEELTSQTTHSFIIETIDGERDYELGVEDETQKEMWLEALGFHLRRLAEAKRRKHKRPSQVNGNGWLWSDSLATSFGGASPDPGTNLQSLHGFPMLSSTYASEEYSVSLRNLDGWAKSNRYMNHKDVAPVVAQYPEYIRKRPVNEEESLIMVKISVNLPKSLNAFRKLTFVGKMNSSPESGEPLLVEKNFFLCEDLDSVMAFIQRELKNNGVRIPDDELARSVIHESGKEEYLLHRKLALGMFHCVTRSARMKEILRLNLCYLQPDDYSGLQGIIEEDKNRWSDHFQTSGFLSNDDISGRKSLSLHKEFAENDLLSKAQSIREEDGVTLVPQSLAAHSFTISINKVYIPPVIDLKLYAQMQLETTIVMNGKNILKESLIAPLFVWIEQADKSTMIECDTLLKTKLKIADIPSEARVTFRLVGKDRKNRSSVIAGANTSIFNFMDRMVTVPFDLDLTFIKPMLDEEMLSQTNTEENNVVLLDDEGHEIPNFQALHLDHCMPTPKNREFESKDSEGGVKNVHPMVKINASFGSSKNKQYGDKYAIVSKQPSLQHFVTTVLKGGTNPRLYTERVNPDDDQRNRLEEISKLSVIDNLTVSDMDLLWKCRSSCITIPSLLPAFLRAVDWTIELLDISYCDTLVREYAVNRLNELPDMVLEDILLQLVQVLKYEAHHDSPLARFLLNRALNSPLSIGHKLFWMLYSELHLPVLRLQVFVNDCLKQIAQDVKLEPNKKKRLDCAFLCLTPKILLRGIRKMPLWLVFENIDPSQPDFNVIFKDGDDLRQDQLTLQLIAFMDSLWQLVKFTMEHHTGLLDLKMKPYGCFSTGFNTGVLECVMSSKTLASIQTEYGGKMSGAFSKSTMISYLRDNNTTKQMYDVAVDNFIETCAGYCVCTYVLGIGDRHADNIMIQNCGHFFHIDFGHFLGNFKTKMGINRERSAFVFTPEMAEVPLPEYMTPMTEFESKCVNAFNILRSHSNLLINLFVLMIPACMPELIRTGDVNYLRDHLHLELNDHDAADKFMKEIAQSLSTFSRQFDNFIHNVKHH